ncbi:MAG: energy transducer TonB [Flavobacteriaceae bacterium]
MKFLNTTHKKKSAGLTTLVAALLLLLFFLLGLTYYDPPISYGMEVNFGTQGQGSGRIQPKEVVASKPTPVETKETPETKESTPTPIKDIPVESKEVVTQDESSVAVPKKQEAKLKPQPEEKTPKEKAETTPQKEVPKVSDATKSVVSNLLKNKSQEGEKTTGEGDDLNAGDKGKLEGDPYASSYYGNTGLGGRGKGYGLNGRNLQSNGKVVQDCNQEGTVVVRITVNQQGNVIEAEPGVKGSTNTHPCLMAPAKRTALLHKWYPDPKAPDQQIGFVVIQFKLGE